MPPAAPLPVIVVTGALGVGKTTAIAAALAAKPAAEKWVVILNEFTDSGIDVLTVAGAARGEFDVRLVAGGCLCCVGAEDYGRTLESFVRGARPARLYIEPSGLGAPGLVLDELLAYEARGEIDLVAVVALVDARRLDELSVAGTARDQVEAADVVLLARADAATAEDRTRFEAFCAGLYPPRRLIGECHHGQLPEPLGAGRTAGDSAPAGESSVPATSWRRDERPVPGGARRAGADRAHVLGRDALAFRYPRSVAFDEDRLLAALGGEPLLAGVERLKGVFRVGPETWQLVQRVGGEVSVRPSSWRRDSRVELLARDGVRLDRASLAQFWRSVAARTAADRR